MYKILTVVAVFLCVNMGDLRAENITRSAVYDHVITNALIYDGSGGEPYKADIGIRGEKIVKIGDIGETDAEHVTDAKGMAVSPGFINMLSWAIVSLQTDGRGMSDVLQGVTLEVFGEGETLGPMNDRAFEVTQATMSFLKRESTSPTFGGWMESLEAKGISPNVASYVGATTIRSYVMGYKMGAPSKGELLQMKGLVKDAMEEGALGLGSSLIYVPAQYATTEELTELMKVVAPYGGSYISHIRSESNNLLSAAREIIEISKNSGAPAEFYHLKSEGPDNWDKMDVLLELIEQARSEGHQIWADMYTYAAASTGLDSTLPPWVLEGGIQAMLSRLADPALREQAKKEMNIASDSWDNGFKWASPDGMLLVGFSNKAMKRYIGKTVGDVARETGLAAEYAIMDLLKENGEGRIDVVYFSMSEENIRKKIQKPWVTFGSDGISRVAEGEGLNESTHPRDYGTFARLLGRYVRDEKLITLPEAIHRLTGLPAKRLKIEKRGLLREGYYADITIFDPENIQDHATFENPHQYSTGVHHVWVNGGQVVKNGRHTGKKPGKFVRGPGWKKPINQEYILPLTLTEVHETAKRIASLATRTPLKPSFSLTEHLGSKVFLKMETMQATGAFKLRGATNAVLNLSPDVRARGIVTASSGNHGRAIAYVAKELNIPAVICLSDLVPDSKVNAIKKLGAEVCVGGKDQDVAMENAHKIAAEQCMTYIGPFDEIDVIAGQATIGVEILEDNPDLDTLVVPVSGGGLVAGVGFAVKKMKPSVRIIGVTMERGAAMYHSIKAGKPTNVEELTTIADALQGGICLDNQYTFEMSRSYVDDFMLISEDQIKNAMRHAYRHEHLVLEGSGACGIGLLLDERARDFGDNIVTICSGDNIDPDEFLKVISNT